MTEQQVINQFRRKRPRTVTDLLERCGLSLRYLDNGAFRKVYQVENLPLVVKIPISGGKLEHNAHDHARKEFSAYSRIKRSKTRFKELQPYMPEVLYFNVLGGVMLMREYDQVPGTRKYARLMNEASRKADAVLSDKERSTHDCDLGEDKWDNFGIDRNGTLKIIDLGLLLPVMNGDK